MVRLRVLFHRSYSLLPFLYVFPADSVDYYKGGFVFYYVDLVAVLTVNSPSVHYDICLEIRIIIKEFLDF